MFPSFSSGFWPISHLENGHALRPRVLLYSPHCRRAKAQINSLKIDQNAPRPSSLGFPVQRKVDNKRKILYHLIWIVLRVFELFGCLHLESKWNSASTQYRVLYSRLSNKSHSCSSSYSCFLPLTLPAAPSWGSNLIFFQLLVVYRFTQL